MKLVKMTTIKMTMLATLCFGMTTLNSTPISAAGTSELAAAVQRLHTQENQANKKYADAVQIIFRNASCYEAENLDAFMDTISADCDSREMTREISRNTMEMDLDLKIDITSFEILPGGTDKLVRIRCSQLTTKVGGATRFVDNELRAIHTVVKTDDGWKIRSTQILHIDMTAERMEEIESL